MATQNHSKRKGNLFENQCAKKLSKWMFNDENVLKKHPSSGADKSVWKGDIIPLKQINWKKFPFFIETKHGYKTKTPTFFECEILNKWFLKALEESKETEQEIVWIICKFHGRKTLLISSIALDYEEIIPLKLIPLKYNNKILWMHIYDFKQVLSKKFKDLKLDLEVK